MGQTTSLKSLVIVPHADDETICCGGTIAKLGNVDVVVVAMGWFEIKTALKELNAACEILGVNNLKVLYQDQQSFLDQVPQDDLVRQLDGVLNERRYDQVFIPCPGQHHHDHRAVHEACFAALRDGVRPAPSLIAMYEYTLPGWIEFTAWHGRLYVDITEQIDRKLNALDCYQSQLSRHTNPLHPLNNIRLLARSRGAECGREYAEMFYIAKEIR